MKIMNTEVVAYGDLDKFRTEHPGLQTENSIDFAIDELFDIRFPAKKDSKTADEVEEFSKDLTGGDKNNWGEWIYYPWLNKVVHFPPKDDLRSLRTSRNRNLITVEEQAKLYSSTIFIIGMSVGSNIVEALASMGIGGKLILVDMDVIEPSNLNRIRSPYHHVGLHKIDAISRKVWEMDPYIEIIALKDGLNEENLKLILTKHQPDVIVDEMDSLKMKLILREEAKKVKLPIVMAADDGDDSLLDIERYDLKSDLEPFSGQIPPEILAKIREDQLTRPEIGNLIGKYFVGIDNIPLRMFRSLVEVGKTLPSWPQLGGAAALSGIVVAYAVRKILLGEDIKDGRILISLDDKIDLERHKPEHQAELAKFRQMMGG